MENDVHIEQASVGKFNGNYLYASHNAFGKTLSRRDDLISLVNLLCYYLNGPPKWLEQVNDDESILEQVSRIKKQMTPEDVCRDKAQALLPFYREILTYKFDQEPDYQKLKWLLKCLLLENNTVPNILFDWSEFQVITNRD